MPINYFRRAFQKETLPRLEQIELSCYEAKTNKSNEPKQSNADHPHSKELPIAQVEGSPVKYIKLDSMTPIKHKPCSSCQIISALSYAKWNDLFKMKLKMENEGGWPQKFGNIPCNDFSDPDMFAFSMMSVWAPLLRHIRCHVMNGDWDEIAKSIKRGAPKNIEIIDLQ
eukprot:gb/GECH01001561.1/.p1 GENE.gb/GECH01001561.1/~~gb/GECH01001561.1/.p1  ORF type:complete len:169 (+),score=28.80 gb/GECH01001561.1/:1-507(+)